MINEYFYINIVHDIFTINEYIYKNRLDNQRKSLYNIRIQEFIKRKVYLVKDIMVLEVTNFEVWVT